MSQTFTVFPKKINKIIHAPASKSVMQRVISCAILSNGTSTILNPSFCDDCKAALKIAKDLGCEVFIEKEKITITPGKKKKEKSIDCGESGLGVRMFSPVISLFGNDLTITGKGSLLKRPVEGIENALKQGGVTCYTNAGFLPLTLSGKLKGGDFTIDGSKSSQVLTGLLTALPYAEEDSHIKVKNLKSKPYIDLSLEILEDFGITIINDNYTNFYIKGKQEFKAQTYSVEGDWSGAAFLIIAGLIAGKTEIIGLNINSKQADIKILDAIKKAEGKIKITEDSIIAEKSNLKSFEFDATHCPDLFPPLTVMAAYCKGTSKIKGVSRLIYKESNRAEALQKEFSEIGIKISIHDDEMHIEGGNVIGGIAESHNDHRIAMAAATIALSAEKEIIINDSECINKSYPGFYKDLLD